MHWPQSTYVGTALRPNSIQLGAWTLEVKVTLSIKAQEPYIRRSWGPKALKYESFDAKGYRSTPSLLWLERAYFHDRRIHGASWVGFLRVLRCRVEFLRGGLPELSN